MSKKFNQLIATLLITTMTLSIPVYAQSPPTDNEAYRQVNSQSENNNFSSYDDEILNQMIIEYGLTDAQVTEIDDALSDIPNSSKTRSISVAAVVGTVAGVIAITGATYAAGRYAARQCEVRLGLSKSQYRANRWTYRAALAGAVFVGGTTGAIVALGFDDYYMGV